MGVLTQDSAFIPAEEILSHRDLGGADSSMCEGRVGLCGRPGICLNLERRVLPVLRIAVLLLLSEATEGTDVFILWMSVLYGRCRRRPTWSSWDLCGTVQMEEVEIEDRCCALSWETVGKRRLVCRRSSFV